MQLQKLDQIKTKFNELHEQFIEMGQLKSDFDIDKFTIASKGEFPAHQFHMLMRQYSLALYESIRMLIEKEEKLRNIDDIENDITKIETGKYKELEILKLKNEIMLLEISLQNKLCMVNTFEKSRNILIEQNGGKPFTNEEYQAEEPVFWEWNLKQKALNQASQARTGIQEGIWEAICQLEAPATLDEANQVKMIGSDGNLSLPSIGSRLDNKTKMLEGGS
jgi:hypothetical protein